MKFIELKQDLKANRRSVYLFEGEDAYFRASAEKMVKDAFLQNEQLNFTSFDGSLLKGSAIQDLVSALSVFPFMSEYRIVRVNEFYPAESDFEKYIKPLFENFPETSILVIVNRGGGKGCDLKRKKFVSYFDCSKTDRDTVARWCYLTMKRAGVSASAEACEAVADYCLCDMARVSKETEKLIEWGKDGLITKSDVDELVYKDADYRIWQMTAAAARGDYSSFAEILSDLLTKGYDVNTVTTSLLNYFKNLLVVLKNPSSGALAEKLKLSDYILGKTRRQAAEMGEERLTKLIPAIYALSSDLKSGNITADGALNSLEALCMLRD